MNTRSILRKYQGREFTNPALDRPEHPSRIVMSSPPRNNEPEHEDTFVYRLLLQTGTIAPERDYII